MKQTVRESLAEVAAQDAVIDRHIPPEEIPPEDPRTEYGKLSRLIHDDFPFDESQLEAIYGMACERYACLTGAAGTGKTTTTKKLVDTLLSESNISSINMAEYFRRGKSGAEDEDDYEMPEKIIPAVAMCSFTGKATQQIKKNFPRDWHGNIMTIHRLLAFVPEYYEAWDEETEQYKNKMRFIPTYNADCLLPWDIIIIDEAGMTGLELWHQLWDACKPGCRIYMIGDINQLPPVHGRSIFGFAMANWPSFELTHIHRQKGVMNPIVENAWRILKGEMPKAEGKFQMIELPGEAGTASRKVRGIIPELRKRGIYEPNRDTIITAINGNEGSRGAQLGQIPLNNEFSLVFNPQSESVRYFIDAARERKTFAVGDKVMATKNDHEAGITNGMMGIITSINANGAYAGDHLRFGPIEEVNRYLKDELEEVDVEDDFTLDDLSDSFAAVDQGQRDAKDKRDRGPSSHIVTVLFGDKDHGFELPFASLSEVGSLQTAYVVTCHKMQGGESPVVIIIAHDAHKQMLYREWLYTAVTRASEMCILLYSPTALRTGLNKQNIKGSTLRQKVEAFNALQKNNGLGAAVSVTIPIAERLYEPETPTHSVPMVVDVEYEQVPALVIEPEVPAIPEPEIEVIQLNERTIEQPAKLEPTTIVHQTIHVHVHQTIQKSAAKPKASLKELLANKGRVREIPINGTEIESPAVMLALPAPPETFQWQESSEPYSPKMEPDQEIIRLRDSLLKAAERRQTKPVEPELIVPPVKPKNPWATKLGGLKA
jgi:hypothetical protein